MNGQNQPNQTINIYNSHVVINHNPASIQLPSQFAPGIMSPSPNGTNGVPNPTLTLALASGTAIERDLEAAKRIMRQVREGIRNKTLTPNQFLRFSNQLLTIRERAANIPLDGLSQSSKDQIGQIQTIDAKFSEIDAKWVWRS